MYTNPYGQAGWSASASGRGSSSSEYSSVYGALPYSSLPALQGHLLFEFSSFQPNILNCLVLSPDQRPLVAIDSNSLPGCTLIKDKQNAVIATIKWRDTPAIEIPGICGKTKVGRWLTLSPDNSQRVMTVFGQPFAWVPRRNTVNLYDASQNKIAKLERKTGSVALEMTPQALQLNILIPCIVATVLLMSGNNID